MKYRSVTVVDFRGCCALARIKTSWESVSFSRRAQVQRVSNSDDLPSQRSLP